MKRCRDIPIIAVPFGGGGGGGGTMDHTALDAASLIWPDSAHTGTAGSVAVFGASGAAAVVTGSDGQFLGRVSGVWTAVAAPAATSGIAMWLPGGGGVIAVGTRCDLNVPFACTINAVSCLLDDVGSIVVDVWRSTYAAYPPTVADSITGGNPITVTTDTKSLDSTLTGWSTSLSAGDCLRLNADSVTDAKDAAIMFFVTRA